MERDFIVMRTREKKVSNFWIGDKIIIPLAGLGTFTATANKIADEGVLFIFDDCVAKLPMNRKPTSNYGFEESSLKKWMDTRLLEAFPNDLKSRIKKLSIPTIGESFNKDDKFVKINIKYFEPDTDEQLLPMKKRRNRVTYLDNELECCWLRNAVKKEYSSSSFALVNICGDFSCDADRTYNGVRPEFWLVK